MRIGILSLICLCVSIIASPKEGKRDINTIVSDVYNDISWLCFDYNDYNRAIKLQISLLDSLTSHDKSHYETNSRILQAKSNLVLYLSEKNIPIDSIYKISLKLNDEFSDAGIIATPAGIIQLARTGYYSFLREDFVSADSLISIAYQSLKKYNLEPRQEAEIYCYKIAYLLGTRNSLKDESYTKREKKRKKQMRQAKEILAKASSKIGNTFDQEWIFSRYILSMAEFMAYTENGNLFSFKRDYDICKNFQLGSNTENDISFIGKDYYRCAIEEISDGQIIAALKIIEISAPTLESIRGASPLVSKQYALASHLYENLYNYSQSSIYIQKARAIDQILGENAFRPVSYYDERDTLLIRNQEMFDSICNVNPLYGFEQALLLQGSPRYEKSMFNNEYVIPAFSVKDSPDYNMLIEEMANIYANNPTNAVNDFGLTPLWGYRINKFVETKTSVVWGIDPDELCYYHELERYSQSLSSAKNIIYSNLANDREDASRWYAMLSKYYFYTDDIDNSISAQKACVKSLSQRGPTDSMYLASKKTLTMLNMLGMWQAISNSTTNPERRWADRNSKREQHKKITMYQNEFISTGDDYLSSIKNLFINNYIDLDYNTQRELWRPMSRWFYNTIPYMGTSPQAAITLYNGALFSKGLLLEMSKGFVQDCEWKDVQKALGDGDMAIEFVNFRNMHGFEIYYALTLTSNDVAPQIYPLFSKFELDDLNLAEDEYYTHPEVYDLIIRPIPISHKIKNIYFSPTGILNTIAIENLADSTNVSVNNKWNIYRLSSTRELNNRSRPKIDVQQMVIYGDLDYDMSIKDDISNAMNNNTYERFRGGKRSRYDRLQYSSDEIAAIGNTANRNNVSVYIYRDSLGTEESFKQIGIDSPSILHFSTHGFFYSDDKMESIVMDRNKHSFVLFDDAFDVEDRAMTRSALVLSGGNNVLRGLFVPDNHEDGILTALEIANLNLSKCDIVSLSACETALGLVDGEGVFGLQRGFKKAGVESILMSLWEVDDQATSLLMQKFYELYLSGKYSKIESLQGAQDYIKNFSLEYRQPYYWAGWILLDALN